MVSDYWQAGEAFVPKGQRIQSKAETYTVEGYGSLFGHILASLRRKPKCYSKCAKMLGYSDRLLMGKWNKKSILK